MSTCRSYGERCGARRIALLFDLGDTLMIEESEVKDAEGTTLRADLLPGAAEALRWFKEQGYALALVADARPDTPVNVLRQHGLYEHFDYLAISEIIGAEKPEPLIFQTALKALRIPEDDYGRVAMVGNNLERDIVGANRLGLISIFFHWNDRRRSQPLTAEEEPRYTVSSIRELVSLVASFNNSKTCEALEPWESS
ncbi:MAG: HAD family hydrolase [Anaerolineae bacterium]|jgi:FMN phosphatase YigB (HAD superfamily)